MLGIYKSYNGQAAADYFKNSLSKEGNYYQEKEVVAHWDGKTGVKLMLHGSRVTGEVFSDFVHNKHYGTKDRLTVINAKNRRAGYDFTFSAPKSASVLYGITKDPDILSAHRYAYRSTMQEIEKHIQTQANTQKQRGFITTGNIIYAAFDHFESRPVEVHHKGRVLYIPDMQMHTHCYVPNVTWVEEKKRFQAIETGNIHKLAPYFEAYYHALMSHRLNELGYITARTHERWEISGVSRAIIERYSNRGKQIDLVAKEKGITSLKEKAKLAVITRNSKGKAVDDKQLYELWKARLSEKEFSTLQNIKNSPQHEINSISAKEAVERSLEHFLERQSTAHEKRVLGHALSLGYGTLLPEEVTQALNEREDILRSEDQTISIITTREMVRAENKMIELAANTKGKFKPIHPNYKPKRDFLNEGQMNAVKAALSSPDFITGIQGNAGAGKTTLLSEIADGVKQKNKTLVSIAPSSQAVEVLRKEGFDAYTVAAFLVNSKVRQKIRNGVLLYDEAGLSGVKSMTQVLEKAQAQNAQVILSGDTKQHNAPGEYGDAFYMLQKSAQIRTAHVKENMRQEPKEYRKAVNQIASGNIRGGYQTLDKMNAIQEIPDTDQRLNQIADDYLSSIQKKRSALIVSPTHAEGDQITAIVRQKLKEKGVVKGKERSFETLKNLSFTESQKKDLVNYQQGQIIRFTKNQKGGFKAGTHYEVVSQTTKKTVEVRDVKTKQVLELPYNTPTHFSVYQKTQTQIAVGDLIRPTENLKSKENTKINNGTPQKVKGFVGGDIKLAKGKTLDKNSYHFKHGYVDTSHSSQGKTASDVYISMTDMSFGGVNEQSFYVGVSRGKNKIQLYTSDKQELKKAMVRSAQRTTARDIEKEHAQHIHRQKQRDYHQNIHRQKEQYDISKQRDKTIERHISRRI
ncbi:MobF family relaxase [Tenacibaculum sp. ZS6-P6]|uniref:MobF family relaxase n=1 Tax=Tenacibaculum sp. ZS6-P6 TaxID=3447503 RepID=UPI003F954AD7